MGKIDDEFPFVETLNLGDSGFMIVRVNKQKEMEIVFRSKE